MKKLFLSLFVVMALFGGTAAATFAAPAEKSSEPFTGTFSGTVYGDNDTTAPMTLTLVQDGDEVTGTAAMGEGLYVDAGLCGSGYIPASSQTAAGEISARNPNHLEAQAAFDISGFRVNIDLDGFLVDADTLEAETKIDLPWLCGTDPVLYSSLERVTD